MSADASKVPILETARLTLRPWAEGDAPNLLSAFGDAGAMRFWNTPPSATAEELGAMIAHSQSVSSNLHAAWSVLLKPKGEAVGMVNYHHKDTRNGRLEIGFIIAPTYWGSGLAREAVGALLRYCFVIARHTSYRGADRSLERNVVASCRSSRLLP